MAAKNFSTRIQLLIKRDMTELTPVVIWAHERPLLEAIHDAGNVLDVDASKLDEGYKPKIGANMLPHNKVQDTIFRPSETLGLGFIFAGDPASEYQRLIDVYGMHPEVKMPWVENVFGRFQEGRFERLLPKPVLKDLPDSQLRTLVAAFGYPGDVQKDATLEEKRAQAAQVRDLRVMPNEGLLKLCADIGVEL